MKRDEEQNILINRKIIELKQLFRRRKYNRVGQLYEVLNELVKLKQKTNPRYAPRSLENEEGINLTGSQIRYIFAYQYICEYTKKKVLEGKIDDSTVCHALAVSSRLREIQWQIRFVDKLINKEIKPSSISELNQEEIKNVLLDKEEITESDNYFLSATKSLRNIKDRIEKRKHLLKGSLYEKNLINSIKNLSKLLEELK